MTIASTLSGFFRGLRCTLHHLSVIRVPLAIVAVGAVLTWKVPQIRELFSISVATASADRLQTEHFIITLASTVLAFAVWYTARTLLRFDLVRSDSTAWARAHPTFQEWAPRILATAIPLLVAAGFLGADFRRGLAPALLVALMGFVVLATTMLRRRVQSLGPATAEECDRTNWRACAPWRTWITGVVLFAIINLLACIPRLQPWVGVASSLLGPLACLLVLATIFVLATAPLVFFAATARVPAFTLILAWASLIQSLGWVDNHAISMAHSETASTAVPVPLQDRIDDWLNTQSGCKHAYFVTTEGGGIRAAAWTAVVLSRLHREIPDFVDCWVAGSGVSGGSLGMAAFVAGRNVLAQQSSDAQVGEHVSANNDPLEDKLWKMLTHDFMTPLIATTFTSDQLQRLVPYLTLPDRGTALETAFADAFAGAFEVARPSSAKQAGTPTNPFLLPLRDLYASTSDDNVSRRWTPILMFNTTEVRTGSRVIQSAFTLPNSKDMNFPGAKDLHELMLGNISLVGAVHNSARFSYVSPAGTIPYAARVTKEIATQLVDGGYFENSGATTLLDVLRLYRGRIDTIASLDGSPGPVPVVIHISNDPSVRRLEPRKPFEATAKLQSVGAQRKTGSTNTKVDHHALIPALGEIVPPPFALYMTRSARADYAREALFRAVQYHKPEGHVAQFGLDNGEGSYPIPLGWRIGDGALCEMVQQRDVSQTMNQEHFKALHAFLNATPERTVEASVLSYENKCPSANTTALFSGAKPR